MTNIKPVVIVCIIANTWKPNLEGREKLERGRAATKGGSGLYVTEDNKGPVPCQKLAGTDDIRRFLAYYSTFRAISNLLFCLYYILIMVCDTTETTLWLKRSKMVSKKNFRGLPGR